MTASHRASEFQQWGVKSLTRSKGWVILKTEFLDNRCPARERPEVPWRDDGALPQ